MLVDFGKANILNKARQQPDKVRMVLEKVKTDGLMPTIASVRNKLDQPLTLGYCNVGVALEVGSGISGYKVGDRIASNGKHAEIVTVPENLCAKIPEQVSDEAAAFTVIGAIALQGIRLAQPTLGEAFGVTGLGVIGLMAVQLLRSHGCRVLAIDLDEQRLELARRFGARNRRSITRRRSGSRGGDFFPATRASTAYSSPLRPAATSRCTKRRRCVGSAAGSYSWAWWDWNCRAPTFTKRNCLSKCPAPMVLVGTILTTRREGRTIRLGWSAGPNNATSKRSWICWPRDV